MKTYSEHQPTGFDARGAFLPDRQQWLVAPVVQTRDSGCLDQSNFACFLRELGGESETVEVHRFGHWGPGWYEIILIDPSAEDTVRTAEECEGALSDYSILDESDFSTREWESATGCWAHMRVRERAELCKRYNCNIFAARRDTLPEDDSGSLFQYLAE